MDSDLVVFEWDKSFLNLAKPDKLGANRVDKKHWNSPTDNESFSSEGLVFKMTVLYIFNSLEAISKQAVDLLGFGADLKHVPEGELISVVKETVVSCLEKNLSWAAVI